MAIYESEFGEFTVDYRSKFSGDREYEGELASYAQTLLSGLEQKYNGRKHIDSKKLYKIGRGIIEDFVENIGRGELSGNLYIDLNFILDKVIDEIKTREAEDERESERRFEERAGVYGEREPEEYYDSDFRYGDSGDY